MKFVSINNIFKSSNSKAGLVAFNEAEGGSIAQWNGASKMIVKEEIAHWGGEHCT